MPECGFARAREMASGLNWQANMPALRASRASLTRQASGLVPWRAAWYYGPVAMLRRSRHEESMKMSATEIQYISDAEGNSVGVIVPIKLWREIESERETAYLLRSETMKRRLLEAKERATGISLEAARAKLGI
jgi:PHD/YefM family antitoxin component YafN of YafNO toxin-antitoxin module